MLQRLNEAHAGLLLKRQKLLLERRQLTLQIRVVRKESAQQIKDLSSVIGPIKKRLVEIERMKRDCDLNHLQSAVDRIDELILEIENQIVDSLSQ